MPHVIRLRGPWHYQALARTVLLRDGLTAQEPGDLPPPGRTSMPSDWGDSLGSDFRGQVRYTRTFHRPTGLDKGQRVAVTLQQVDAWGRVWLNGHLLGEIPPAACETRFEVTDQLLERNELTVEVELPRVTPDSPPLARPAQRAGKPGGLVGEVRLEIG